jgi:predicted ribosome quality control (RQC) complex YloA/Tae2 family protein
MSMPHVHARPGDRVLEIGIERRDAIGRREDARLVAELFDRGGNVLLLDRAGGVLAALRDRPPARRRDDVTVAPATAAAPAGVGLAATAHLALADLAAAELVRNEARRLRRDVAHFERLLDKLCAEDAEAGAAQRCRQDAELLAANLHRVRRGQARVEVEDWFAGDAPRTLELDPELSPQDNVARLFKRARRGERGHDTIVARRADAAARLAAARDALAALPSQPTWEDALRTAAPALRAAAPRAATTPLASLWAPGGPERDAAPQPPAKAPDGPGRRFVLAGDWEVRVGRSNAENDELTHRFAAPDDVWLHASGVAGSHVVLRMRGRADNPPRDVLEAAAAIAARFSKAKHAGTVPVVWTRRRYVRKPRGSAAGLAACTHEKTVFVKPALPEGTDDGA